MNAGSQYEFHPLSNLFPMMSESDLQRFADDIKANGQQEFVYLFEGKILDGRNREKACFIAGVDPVYIEWDGDPAKAQEWVVSKNLHRRHLTDSQRLTIVRLHCCADLRDKI